MVLAWHIARLNAYAPVNSRTFPKLSELLTKPANAPQETPAQSPDQLLAAARVWMANRQR